MYDYMTPWPLTRDLLISDRLITQPEIEPIDLEEVKKHIRWKSTREDSLLDTYIAAARQFFEIETDRQLIAATWERQFDAFPSGVIELPHPPLLNVLSVIYTDGDGNDQTLVENTDYTVDAPSGPQAARGILKQPFGTVWPTPLSALGSVRVRYRAGYGEAVEDVPDLIKGCLYYLVGHFHRFREEVQDPQTTLTSLPIGAQAIMKSFKYTALPIHPAKRSWVGL